MKYKTEILMLLMAIAFFGLSAFCYSYTDNIDELALSLNRTYPYQAYVIPLISTGFVLMGIASVSYSKKVKVTSNNNF